MGGRIAHDLARDGYRVEVLPDATWVRISDRVRVLCVADESRMDAITAVSGSGPAYFFKFAEALVGAAMAIGFTRDEAVPGAFNVASGTPRSVGEMAGVLADAAGEDAPRPVVTGQYRLGDVRHVFASPERARRMLGFSATEDFRAGMAEFSRDPLRAA